MPTENNQSTDKGRVEGRTFVWPTEDGDEIRIPMRLKLKVLRAMEGVELDATGMFRMLEALIPDQAEALDEMDVNEFGAMFDAWNKAYTAQEGVTLGEPRGSSS